MSDAMIERLAESGGVIMINFGSSFLRSEYQEEERQTVEEITANMEASGLDRTSPEGIAFFSQQRKANPIGTIDDVVEHLNHVRDLVGVDHIGLGSDFDGVFALPSGLQDVADYPNLVYRLLQEGYSERDIEKILGGERPPRLGGGRARGGGAAGLQQRPRDSLAGRVPRRRRRKAAPSTRYLMACREVGHFGPPGDCVVPVNWIVLPPRATR